MSSNFAKMSLEDLVILRENANKLIAKKQKEMNQEIRAKMNDLAIEAGFDSVEDFIGSQSRKKKVRRDKGVRLPPKYRHPENGHWLWSGRGPAPKWIVEYERNGGSRKDWQVKI